MAMTIEGVIAGLQADVAAGYFKMDDVLVIDWFSFRDVQRKLSDFDDDKKMSDDTAREIWEDAVEEIDIRLDWYDTDDVNAIIASKVRVLIDGE